MVVVWMNFLGRAGGDQATYTRPAWANFQTARQGDLHMGFSPTGNHSLAMFASRPKGSTRSTRGSTRPFASWIEWVDVEARLDAPRQRGKPTAAKICRPRDLERQTTYALAMFGSRPSGSLRVFASPLPRGLCKWKLPGLRVPFTPWIV